jgi:glycerol-3-phosphate cytidylyltransferase
LILLNNKNRQLKLKGIKGTHTIEEWETLKKQFGFKCAICGITETEIKKKWKNTNFDCLTKDHIVPISKGGTNYISNIRPTCISCNSEKYNKKAFKIIFTSGSWDLLHFGHLQIFLRAKELGDYLIVGVSTDSLIKKYKNLSPIIPYKERKLLIKQLKCVDKVVPQTKLVDINQFKKLKADIFVLGDDWKDRYDNEGINWLRQHNKIIFLPYTKHLSTSKIKEKIIRNAVEIIQSQSKRK